MTSRINTESAVHVKTFTAGSPIKLDRLINEFLEGIETKFVRDVKFSTTYDQENYSTDFHALVTYSYARVNGWTD